MPKCRFPACTSDLIEGSTLCALHHAQRELYRNAKKAARKNKGVGSVLSSAAAFLLDANNPVGRVVGNVAKDYADDAKTFVDATMGSVGLENNPAPEEETEEPEVEEEEPFEWEYVDDEKEVEEAKTDPWKILGLNPEKCTVDIVRKRQRRLASIYHSDQEENEADVAEEEKLKEINQAASDCIEILKSKESKKEAQC